MEERHVSKIVVDLLLERKNENTGKKEILMMLANLSSLRKRFIEICF